MALIVLSPLASPSGNVPKLLAMIQLQSGSVHLRSTSRLHTCKVCLPLTQISYVLQKTANS